jgi:hypothetical protein
VPGFPEFFGLLELDFDLSLFSFLEVDFWHEVFSESLLWGLDET